MDGFHVITHIGQTTACLHPVGELDLHSSERLDLAQRRIIDTYPVAEVMIDLHQVTLMDVMGLGVLVTGQRHAKECDVRYWVTNAHGIVARLIAFTGLTSVLTTP